MNDSVGGVRAGADVFDILCRMEKTLVVGATGQLGLAVVKRLLEADQPVRAMVRNAQGADRMRTLGAAPVMADLKDPASLDSACSGISVVVATANSAVPSSSHDTFETVELHGYRNLLKAAQKAGVSRLVYTSAVPCRSDQMLPFLRYKLATESSIRESGIDHVIFRAGIFMDVSFAMMGSTIPVRGSEGATVLRPFPFVANHLQRVKDSIERDGVAVISGDGTTRHSFICVDDLACLHAKAAYGGPSGTFDAGGPEALTFLDVVRIYEAILNVKLRVKKTPAWVFRLACLGMRPFHPAGSNLMGLNYIAATENSILDPDGETPAAFGISLTTAEAFLRARYAAG